MRHKVFLEPQAKVDIISIKNWYEAQKPGLDDEFIAELLEHIELLKENPFLFQIRFHALRAMVLRKFPYLVYYFITQNEIHIIGVIAAKQDQQNILKKR